MVSSHIPPCVTIAINATQRRKTLAAMLKSKAFVLGFPSGDQVKEAVHAPIIYELPLSLECEIVHTVTVGSHMQVTGEVKRIIADDNILTDKGRIDLNKLKPINYDEEQVRYMSGKFSLRRSSGEPDSCLNISYNDWNL